MKALRQIWTLSVAAVIAISLFGSREAVAQGGAQVSFQTFYDELSPYGRWIQYPEYGYVWAPDVEAGFQPYATRGHWVMTEYGNTWVSDYRWDWAPFHYGRWLYDDYLGWVWVPGQEWGPAWVNWRTGGDYYGWAPLGPGMHVNVVVNIPVAHWVFIPRRYITSPRFYSYCVPRTRVVNVYHNTTIINNYYSNNSRTYAYGPRANEIEQHTRNRVQVYQVNNDSRPGRTEVSRNAVRIYRPEVQAQPQAAPTNVIAREAARRPERSSESGGSNRGSRSMSTDNRNASGTLRQERQERNAVVESTGRETTTAPATERPTRQRATTGISTEGNINREYSTTPERAPMRRPSRTTGSASEPAVIQLITPVTAYPENNAGRIRERTVTRPVEVRQPGAPATAYPENNSRGSRERNTGTIRREEGFSGRPAERTSTPPAQTRERVIQPAQQQQQSVTSEPANRPMRPQREERVQPAQQNTQPVRQQSEGGGGRIRN